MTRHSQPVHATPPSRHCRPAVRGPRQPANARRRAARVALVGLLWGASMAWAAPPTIDCNSDLNLFNTGYDPKTGKTLPTGARDPLWQATGPLTPVSTAYPPPAGVTWIAAYVGNLAPGSWRASPYGNAEWISGEAGTSPNGDWFYRYQFNLAPTVDASSFGLALSGQADNSVAEVYVNGVAQSTKTTGLPQAGSLYGYYFHNGYQAGYESTMTLKQDWRTGLNTIDVLVQSGAPYEGFLAFIRPTRTCRSVPAGVAAVPRLNQWALGLLGVLLGASALRRRSRG